MSKIHKNFIRTFTWSQFSEIISDDGKCLDDKWLYDPNFRIVHLTDCPSPGEFKDTLSENGCLKQLLSESEYLFSVVVDVRSIDKADNFDAFKTAILDVFIDSGKHFLIEFRSLNTFLGFIFDHRKVTTFGNLHSDNTACSSEMDNWRNGESLLDLCLDNNTYVSYIKHAAVGGNSLLIRVLKSFNIKIKLRIERDILEELMKNHQAFRAYLELPIVEANYENSISPNANTQNILKIDFSGKPFLCFAVEKAELDIVKLLLRLGCDVNQTISGSIKTATDLCGTNYELLKLLLDNDAKFPINFAKEFEKYQNCTGSKRDIYDIALDREQLHAAIETKDENGIEKFRTKYPNLRMAYMFIDEEPYNRTATTTSLRKVLEHSDEEESYLRLYAFLFGNGFRDSYAELRDLPMPIGWKEKCSKFLLDVLKYNQPAHIGHLRNKTKIGTIDLPYDKQVDNIYKYLSQKTGDDVHTVLKILEHSQFLTIVIDFHSRYVNPMCPLLNKETDGITYQTEGYIYIGAKDKSNEQIAATLVHELSHYALHITFNNACNPYYARDAENETRMTDITKKIHEIKECDEEVITSAFKYDKVLWARELIVRVPELITLGKRDFFADGEFKKLFDFFNGEVLSVIQRIIAEPEHFRLRKEVEQLNSDLGLVERIKSFHGRGIWPNKTQLPQNCVSLVSSTPNLLLADIFINLIEPSLISSKPVESRLGKRCFIVACIDHMQSQFKKRISRLWRSTSDVTLILYCKDEDDDVSKQPLIEELDKQRNIMLVGSNEKHLKTICDLTPVRVQYSWADIDSKNFGILFEKEIHFQGKRVALNDLIGTDCDVVKLEQLVNDRPIEVETFKVLVDNYDDFQYVNRQFTTYENVHNLLSTLSMDTNTLLLSGVSGCGKSIIFSRLHMEIKKNHPHVWLSRVNLHEWGETFQSTDAKDPIDFLSNILVQTTDETDQHFQRALFRKLYQNSKVVLLFDAYDELTEKYRTPFKKLIEQLNGNVQMWISTRPQFKHVLTKCLRENLVSLELGKFSYQDIYDCATKFWQKNVPKLDTKKTEFWQVYLQKPATISKLKQFATDMISLFTDSIKKFVLGDDFMQPFIVVTLAEYYQETVKEFVFSKSEHFPIVPYVDVFDIYKMIVAKKYMTLYRQKGSEIATETAVDSLFQEAPSYLEHLSLKSKFGPSAPDNLNEFIHVKYTYSEVMDTDHGALEGLLQRSGLISISDDGSGDREIYFIDDSVRDYFIAVFIMKALKRVTRSERSTINNTQFDTAMKVLCINVIHPYRQDSTLITFIDEGLKRFWDFLPELVHKKTYIYFSHMPDITFEFEQPNFVRYLLDENAFFLLTFFLQCFLQQYPRFDSSPKTIVFDIVRAGGLLPVASAMGIFSVVHLFWSENELRKLLSSDRVRTAFREAFLYFPENKIAVVIDNSSFDDAKTAFSSRGAFDDRLQTIIRENFYNSTLYNLLVMCSPDSNNSGPELHLVNVRNRLNRVITGRRRKFLENCLPASACPSLTQEHIDSLIVPKESYFECDKDFVFDPDLFEAYIQMKWIALERVGYRATNWGDVVTNTLFGTVVAKIFCNFNSKVVLKFLKWAFSKVSLRDSWTDFAEYIVVKHLGRQLIEPKDVDGVDEIFRFVKETLGKNLESVYQNRNLEVYFAYVTSFLPIFKKHTIGEFIAFLTCKDSGSESVFEYILSNKSSDLLDILVTFRYFGTTDVEIKHAIENACHITPPYHKDMLETINKSIFHVVQKRRDPELNFDLTIRSLENIFGDSLKPAFQSLISEIELKCTIFHRACYCDDMSVLNDVWHLAKRIELTNDELRNLLLFTNDRVQHTM